MNLSQANLNLLRSQPHRTNLYLSIYRPNTLMTARVTGTYDLGDYQISYSAPSGSYLTLYPDLTVLVGTQAGQDDVGRIRLRGATGTYVVTAENAIHWQNGQHLTFLDYVTVEAIYPRIIQDPNNDENVIFYKDFDIPYSNQNTIYGTFPNAGPHWAGFLETGTATKYYTATGTYNVAGSNLTYSWTFQGGSPSSSTALTPGNVTYSQPGHYRTRLRVTAANGAVDDTYRYVSVYDRPGVGSNTPTLKWELQDLSGSRAEGGYVASFKLFENIGDVRPNALVVIFADTWYGGTKVNIGGNAPGNSSIVFAGYIMADTIKFDYKESSVEFQVGSVSELMKNTEGFSVSCESKASPSTWFELQEMTVPKAIYHYLRWHSTVLKTTDFQYTGDDRLVQYFDADRGSLFDAIDSFMRDGMLGSVISDRQGKLWAEIDSFGYQSPLSSIPTRFTFHKQDWVGDPNIQERRNSELSFIELGGIAFYGVSTNTFSALLTAAPSTVPLYYGKSDRNDGLILTSQEALNQTAGHYLAHFNTRFPNVSMGLAGNYNNLDIAPIEKTYLVIDQNDSVRGKSIQDLPYIVDGMDWNYDSKNELWRPEVTLLQIATGTAGQTVAIPAVPPDGGYGYPEFELPPLPEFPPAGGGGSATTSQVILHDVSYGLLYSSNFDSTSPNWITVNAGLSGLDGGGVQRYTRINWVGVCPNGAVYAVYVPPANPNNAFIARAPSIGSPFTIIYDCLDAGVNGGDTSFQIWGAAINPLVSEQFGFVMGGTSSVIKFYMGANGTYAAGATLSSINLGCDSLSYGDNFWLLTKYNGYIKIAAGGGSATPFSSNIVPWHLRAGTTGITYTNKNGSGGTLIKGENNMGTATEVNTGNTVQVSDGDSTPRFADCDPTGQYIMTRALAGAKGRSSDYGSTFVPIPSLPPGNYWFQYSASGWIAAGGSVVRYSPDFGGAWLNKEGDLTSIAPLPNINMIRVIG